MVDSSDAAIVCVTMSGLILLYAKFKVKTIRKPIGHEHIKHIAVTGGEPINAAISTKSKFQSFSDFIEVNYYGYFMQQQQYTPYHWKYWCWRAPMQFSCGRMTCKGTWGATWGIRFHCRRSTGVERICYCCRAMVPFTSAIWQNSLLT